MCFVFKYVRYSIKNNLYLILGLLFGVAVTLFTADLYENECRLERTLNFGLQEDDDGYEPRINLAGKPLKALKTPQDFVRPRYYTTELGIRQKLFVGVLTSSHTFESLAIALNETIHVADKIMFFSEAEPHKKHELFSHVVTFSDGRLILKPFHMLKYIADNLLGEYDFFYLVNDSTYVNGPKLLKIVQTLSLSQDVHFGHKMDFESKFCTLDGGIIISNQIMVSVVANLDWCVKNAYSESHDANLGRCIVHAADVPCSDTMTGHRYFGHPLVNPDLPKEKILRDTSLLDAVTVWPIKTAQLFYAVHHHFVKHEVLQVESEIEKLRKAILNTTVILPGNISEPAQWPVGSYPPSKPANRFDLLRWDYFTDKHIYLKTDLDNVVNLEGADLLDVQGVMNASKRHIEEKHDGQLVFEKLVNGYRRFDPARGMDYILDIECKDTVTLQKTTLRLEICKPLGKVELVPVPYVTENARVNIVVFATADNQEHMLKFIESYATVCMEKREKSSLLLVLVYEAEHPGKGTSNDIHSAVKKEAVKQSERFRRDNNKIMWLSVKLPLKAPSWPVLNVLIMDLAVRKFSTENLILLLSPNAELRQDFLNRVRMNTVVNAQVFSPIPFTEYHPLVVYNEELPRPSELDINKNYGHYDTTNADQISFYVKDYKAVRKVIENWLPLAHGDKDLASVASGPAADISMYAMFARHSATHVMRAVEPALRLRHVEPSCSAADEMCTDRRAFNLGTRGQLGKLLLEYQSLRKRRFADVLNTKSFPLF